MHHGGERAGLEGLQNDAAIVFRRNLRKGEVDGEESGHAQYCDRHSLNEAACHIGD
jgi:hypothetical protein